MPKLAGQLLTQTCASMIVVSAFASMERIGKHCLKRLAV